MHRSLTVAVALAAGIVAGIAGARLLGPAPHERAEPDIAFRLGEQVEDFAFEMLDGTTSRLAEFAGGAPVVVVMRDTQCPVSRRYGPRTARLQAEYGDRGARFLYVNVSPLDTPQQMGREMEQYGLAGAYVHDPEWRIARTLGTITTAEVFVLDAARRLRYRGAIDDQYGIRYTKPEPRTHYLRDALDQVLAGREVTRPSTLPEGCYLGAEVGEIARHD